ncbi:MAG: WbqC family protein [Bacteroidales bacterium]|nr:WbqC family protein [Bacteroidales bacterium]
MSLLLSTAYLPPVDWFAAVASDASLAGEISPASVVLEACEHYRKQTWRNRCAILTASGKENLLIPIVHAAGEAFTADGAAAGVDRNVSHIPIRDVRIDYSVDWVRAHEQAIASAYGTSAYFEYYKDELFALLESGERGLYAFNHRLINWLLAKLHLPASVVDSREFVRPEPGPSSWDARPAADCAPLDLRERLHPKKAPLYHCGRPYYQVFSAQFGFVEGLSIVDLLFNEGPDSLSVLSAMRPSMTLPADEASGD